MSSEFQNRNRQELRPSLRVDPAMVLRSVMIELPLNEVEQAIESELADNPALERINEGESAPTVEEIYKSVAPQELRRENADYERNRSLPTDDELPDWIDLTATENSLREHVREQLYGKVAKRLCSAASYVIDSLNERGYLESPVEELALACNVALEEMEAVVEALKRCEPRGLGAHTVQECLAAQLADDKSLEGQLAISIVTEFLDDLISRKTNRICRKHRVLPAVVEQAFARIVELDPAPGLALGVSRGSLVLSDSVAVRADLTLFRTEQGWCIDVQGGDPADLRLNPLYKSRFDIVRKDSKFEDEAAHLQEYVRRAERFLQSLSDRRRTIRRIGEYLIEHQSSFLSTGRYEFLQPLTRAKLAESMGVHESTVSRATANKFVQIATGDIVPFEAFFKPGLRIQKMIEEILENENPATPLSDDRIAEMLAKKGVHVARRTVNKYRDKTRMLNSRSRRSA